MRWQGVRKSAGVPLPARAARAFACAALLAAGCTPFAAKPSQPEDPGPAVSDFAPPRPVAGPDARVPTGGLLPADAPPRPEWRLPSAQDDPMPALLREAARQELARRRQAGLPLEAPWAEPALPPAREKFAPLWRRVPTAPDVAVTLVEPVREAPRALAPGDEIEVWVETPLREFDGRYRVDEAGRVEIRCRWGEADEPAATVRLEGLSIEEAGGQIAKALEGFLQRAAAAAVSVHRAAAPGAVEEEPEPE
jgi:hypothetical protein